MESQVIDALRTALERHATSYVDLESSVKEVMLKLVTTTRKDTFRGQIHCPVWRFLISSSIIERGGFADAEFVSHTCAALKFCWRGIVFTESVVLMHLDYDKYSCHFDKNLRKFTETGNRTSWDSIQNAMSAAKSTLVHQTKLAGFEWVGPDHRGLIMNGIQLNLDILSTATKAGLNMAVRQLVEILDGLSPYIVPRVNPVDQRQPDPRMHPNYSFISDPNNPYPDYKETLLRHLISRNRLGKVQDGKFEWNKLACRGVLEECDDLREMIYTLVHIQSGALGRVTEEGTLTWCDDGWRPSSLKYAHEMVVLMPPHNKTNSMTGTDKPIARFSPKV